MAAFCFREGERKMMIKQYRKKPVVISAAYFSGAMQSFEAIQEWIGEPLEYELDGNGEDVAYFWIGLAGALKGEGQYKVVPGDYLVRDVDGEFYPCKPDIFKKTYEQVKPEKPEEEPAYKRGYIDGYDNGLIDGLEK